MPCFSAINTAVKLSTENLQASQTPAVANSHGQTEYVLKETPILTEEDIPSHLRFIGQGGYRPWFLVSVDKARTAVTQPLQPAQQPEALNVIVQLSLISFLRELGVQASPTFLDVKIDVYYNGELCTSTFVPGSARAGIGPAGIVQRFRGRRTNRFVERPFVVVPAGQNSDGSARRQKPLEGGAAKRWNDVATLLRAEAAKLPGRASGELSVLGDYLMCVAATPMPVEVATIQQPGEAIYGVIDVVLTSGRGQNASTQAPQIVEPTAISLVEPPTRRAVNDYVGLHRALSPLTSLAATPSVDLDFDPTTMTFSAPPRPLARLRHRPTPLTPAQAALPKSRLPPKIRFLSQPNGAVAYQEYLVKRARDSRNYRERREAAAERVRWAPGPVPHDVHVDSVCSFASGTYRPVQGERPGSFIEHSVLVGFRFLVG